MAHGGTKKKETYWNIMKHYDGWEKSLETHPISMKHHNTEWMDEQEKKKKSTSVERDIIDIDY